MPHRDAAADHDRRGSFCLKVGGRGWARRGFVRAVVCALALAGTAAALPGVRAAQESPRDAYAICASIENAWRAEDHAALAALIAADGVEIAINSQIGTRNRYSPSQAFYFFKSLFASTEQESFRFARLSEERQAGMLHAVAEWNYRRGDAGPVRAERLFFTLQRGEAGWGVTGVRAVR